MSVYIYIYECVCICVYVCVYEYISSTIDYRYWMIDRPFRQKVYPMNAKASAVQTARRLELAIIHRSHSRSAQKSFNI